MYGTSQRQVRNFFFGSGAPATITLIAFNVVSFFAGAILQSANPFVWLAFTTTLWPQNFWTLVTWPLMGGGHPITVLFAALWAFWVGGSLERSWGTRTFLTFLGAVSALTAFTVWIGSRLLGVPSGMAGLWLAMAAPTIAWCVINPREVIRLYAVLPIPAKWLAILTMVMLWYEMGPPVLGLFALSGCAAAYWYAQHGRTGYRVQANPRGRWGNAPGETGKPPLRFRDFDREPPAARGLNPLDKLRAWRQRRQLEQLWKRSGFSDDEKDNRRR